ncbi:MAG: glycosyl hydrolase-related protein [Acidobacteriota bacterium]
MPQLAAILLVSAALLAQEAPKRVYLAPDDHTDYMWTADEATYRQAFLEMLDYYLAQADQTAKAPADYQSRWNCDGSLWMWIYEKHRSAAQFERLIHRIRTGHISVPLTAIVSCYGGKPAEAVLRGMYYAGSIERRYNLRFEMAGAMENQTQPWGLSALWAGSGARYSWKGVCGCASRSPYKRDREHELYWDVGPDGSRLLVKWNSFFGAGSLGGYAEGRRPGEAIDLVDSNERFLKLYPYRVIGVFGKGSDDLKTLSSEFVNVARKTTTPARRVIVSNELDYFKDVETSYGPSLPTQSLSFGNEWDLYSASMAEVSGRVRRAVERLRAAEALATLVSLEDPAFMTRRAATSQQTWMNLGLYWEHDWTADGPITRDSRAAWHRRLAGEIESYVNTLEADAAAALSRLIRRRGSLPRFYAFNPLGWTRTDVADLPYSGGQPVKVIDLKTGRETASQVVPIGGKSYLRVLAQDVPAAGYKVFEVRPGAGQEFPAAGQAAGGVVENDIYRITVADRGAITSLIDKTRGNREFARTIDGRVINDLGPGAGTLKAENAGPVSVTLAATATEPLNHTTRVTLYRGSRRIDIRNDINQNFSETHAWSYAFNLDQPDVRHEEVGAVIRAKLASQGGHYSDRNARYDWLTLNHFADMTGQGAGVTLSNADTAFMRLGRSTVKELDTATPQISPLAGGQVDGPKLGIPRQGGDTHFLQRFALRTHGGYDAASAMRFALEHQNPLVAAPVAGGSAYPEDAFSAITVSNPNVLLWAWKPAEEGIGRGIIARVWNVSDRPARFTLKTWRRVARIWQTTHIETNLKPAVDTSAARWQFRTYRLELE